ncbi:MAG: hypothetical protein MUC96_28365 [Myxococcaceae bacterium]|jgi:hypothetical protein|nr:hypothetical protein [Myxococcaceae bacterium]
MRAWLAVVSVVAVMASSSAAAQSVVVSDGHTSTMSLNLFGSQSQVTFGFGVHVHRPRRVFAPVVVSPPPVYVQPAPVYVQPPPVYVQPPQVIEAPPVVMSPPPLPAPPPPVVVAPAPVVVAPAPAPQVVTRPPPPREPERPALIGIKYQPGFSGLLTSGPGSVGFSDGRFVHGVGLEARLSRWFALRSDVELRSNSRSYDVIGAKLWLAGADWKVKPFVSASLSGTEYDLRPNALAIGVVGSGGIDVFFGRHFFLTGEVKVRATPDGCCSVPQVTASAGAGVAFF